VGSRFSVRLALANRINKEYNDKKAVEVLLE
jgi:hypothetical protein